MPWNPFEEELINILLEIYLLLALKQYKYVQSGHNSKHDRLPSQKYRPVSSEWNGQPQ